MEAKCHEKQKTVSVSAQENCNVFRERISAVIGLNVTKNKY